MGQRQLSDGTDRVLLLEELLAGAFLLLGAGALGGGALLVEVGAVLAARLVELCKQTRPLSLEALSRGRLPLRAILFLVVAPLEFRCRREKAGGRRMGERAPDRRKEGGERGGQPAVSDEANTRTSRATTSCAR